MDIGHFKKTRILDGGMGQELFAKGLKAKGSLWSATALIEKKYHQLVIDAHLDFIRSGADVIVTNNFASRRVKMIQNKVEEHFNYANEKAGELAAKAKEISKKNVLIAGSLPAQNDTYVLEDNNLLEHMTLSKTTLKPNQSTRGHLHDDLEEVYFFTKGDGIMVLGEEEFSVKADDVVLIPQGKFHRVINNKNESMEFVCVFEKYDRQSDTAKY